LRLYEGMFLLDSNLATKDWSGLEAHILEILKKNQADVLYSERWPDRRLAYEIQGVKKGTYFLAYFKAPPGAIGEIGRDCNLSERILRMMIIQERGLEKEMEQRKNREITAPPSEMSFEDDRYESRDFGYGGRRRREPMAEAVPSAIPAADHVDAATGAEAGPAEADH